MAKKQREPVLAKYTRTLFPKNSKKNPLILKNHPQIPIILDTLSRKEHHHLLLNGSSSDIYNITFLENIAQRLAEEQTTRALREAYFFYVDITSLTLSSADPDHLEEDLQALYKEISNSDKHIVLAINQIEPLVTEKTDSAIGRLGQFIKSILADEQWRFIVLADKADPQKLRQQAYFNRFFSFSNLNEPSAAESLAVLKTFHRDLEDFHHVVIPQEAFSYALSLASHYLSGKANLDKALQLLDSSAARASSLERHDATGQIKAILTNTILINVASSWTQIPVSHLQSNTFVAAEFIQTIQQQVFGQEAAINLIGLILQYARIKLQPKTGPLCSFLLAGPANVGKVKIAYAMAEQLFGHKEALLHVNLDKTFLPRSLKDINVIHQTEQNRRVSLFEAIQQTPYAVVLLENINQASSETLDLFQDIFTQGYAIDEEGNRYDFRHAIVVITSTLGSERIVNLGQPQPADLIQLVLNDSMHNSLTQHQYLSLQELSEEITPILEPYFSSTLLNHVNIIPVAPLDEMALEKIIYLKLKALTMQLDAAFGVELNHAPEVIRFLVQETLGQGKNTKPIDKLLEQHLYACIIHEIFAHKDDKNRPHRLLVQLNDTGQFLRCEFVSLATAEDTIEA